MRRVRPKDHCIHCLKAEGETDDHILPQSYYLDSVSKAVRNQWTAPACQKCNNDLGKAEEELLTRLGLCLNPSLDTSSPTSNISQRVLRSLNPNATKNQREKIIRGARARKILQKMFTSEGTTEGVFPNFGYHAGWSPEEQYGISIPADLPEKNRRKNNQRNRIQTCLQVYRQLLSA